MKISIHLLCTVEQVTFTTTTPTPASSSHYSSTRFYQTVSINLLLQWRCWPNDYFKWILSRAESNFGAGRCCFSWAKLLAVFAESSWSYWPPSVYYSNVPLKTGGLRFLRSNISTFWRHLRRQSTYTLVMSLQCRPKRQVCMSTRRRSDDGGTL